MNKIIMTSVGISKGYDTNPAIRFNEGKTCAFFRVGEKLYDKKAENNTRWLNHSIKAFGGLIERIEKMGLKEGSYVNLSGRLDEDTWDDKGTTKRSPVIILDDIEFCYAGNNGNGKKADGDSPEKPSGNDQTTPEPGTSGGFQPFAAGGSDLY